MEQPVADLVSGAIGGIASLFGADSQSKNVKRTNEMNYRIAKEANQMSWDIARENNAAQLEALKYNNEFNRQQAIDMFNLEADYNDPSKQVARLKAAGINPNSMFQQGSASVGNVDASTPSAASSGISPSMPSLSVPTMQTPPSVINSMFGNIESFTRSLGNLANSKLSVAQKDKIETMLGVEFEQAQKNLKSTELSNAAAEFNLELDRIYKAPEREKGLEKEIQHIATLHQEALTLASEQKYKEAQEKLTKLQQRIESTNLKILRQKAPLLVSQIEKQNNLLDAQRQTEFSQQQFNMAASHNQEEQAFLNDVRAIFEHEQYTQLQESHKFNVLKNKADAVRIYNAWFKDKETLKEQINMMRNKGLISDIQVHQALGMLKQIKNENDAFWMDRLFKYISALIPFAPGLQTQSAYPVINTPTWSEFSY